VATGWSEGVGVLELPYAGRDLSMLILVPATMDGLPALEESFTPANLETCRAALHKEETDIYLPRFTVTSFFSLKQTLAAMGMSNAFAGGADFSGMNGEHNLFIQDALHKAFVNVNEEGTEAAAATGVIVGRTSVPGPFRVNHPFLFLIRDNVTGSILFLGRVLDPTA
jgi:serpin B